MKNRWQLIAVLLVLLAATVACSFSASTANISQAFLAADEAGTQPTTTFTQDQEFWAIVELKNAPDDTKVSVKWIAVSAEGVDPNFLINETPITTGDATIPFHLSNSNLWPVGTYKAEVYLNDELKQTLDFQVQ